MRASKRRTTQGRRKEKSFPLIFGRTQSKVPVKAAVNLNRGGIQRTATASPADGRPAGAIQKKIMFDFVRLSGTSRRYHISMWLWLCTVVIFDLQSVSRGGAGVIHRYAGARLTIRVTFHLISASSHDWKRGRCRTPRTPEAAILGHFVEIQFFFGRAPKVWWWGNKPWQWWRERVGKIVMGWEAAGMRGGRCYKMGGNYWVTT